MSSTESPLMIDFDPYDTGLSEPGLWEVYERARRAGPAVWSERRGGFWLVTGYDDVRTALRDSSTFSSAHGHRIPVNGTQHAIPIDFDPPLHTAYRSLMAEAMSPARVRELRPFLERTVTELVDRFAAADGGDFVQEVALPLPLKVLTEVIGFSSSTVEQFRELTEVMWTALATQGSTVDFATVDRDIHALMIDEIEAHRNRRADDYVSRLLDAEIGDRRLTIDEQANVLLTFAVAGHETTMNAASLLAMLLVGHPDKQDWLRDDPTRAPAFVEEMLRLCSPGQGVARRTTCPASVAGVEIADGDAIFFSLGAANRDPARYPDPDRFDPTRETRGHLGFGWGIHQCLGAPLARAELALLLAALCTHPPLRSAGQVTWSGLRGAAHLGPTAVPVRFDGA